MGLGCAHGAHRQGLDGSLEGESASTVLEKSGWARSVGGVGPYLTLHSRAGITRAAADEALARLQIHELPSARGCTYVLPAADFALGLSVGQGFGDVSDLKVAQKLGVTDTEIERLRERIVGALKRGPLDPDGLKEALGSAVRNLGEEGKKKGVTTTLPIALGQLQLSGHIRRIPTDGRLDQQRYRYALWSPNPLAKCKWSREDAFAELARRFFRWIAPATLAEFQAFAGISGKAAKAAAASLELVEAEPGSGLLWTAQDRDAFEEFRTPKNPHYTLVSSVDGIALLRRSAANLVEEADQSSGLLAGGPKTGHLLDLPNHGIFDRGRLVGLWEFDPDTQSIVWASFIKKDKALESAVKKTEAFVRDELGDARSFSLDSAKSRQPKIAVLRQAAPGSSG
ncbi:MAG: winged helix DNA-binding domain-containing protein [Acidobacteria bacterium]|nr:winged helix DNA-binding domain-containing protein [Acidobacteriota bacterium]